MTAWPEKGDPASFGDLADAIKAALLFAYTIKRRNVGKDIPWSGPNDGFSRYFLASNLPPAERLTADQMKWDRDEHGRSALDVLIWAALAVGIEQGRRIEQQEIRESTAMVRAYLDQIGNTIDRSRWYIDRIEGKG